VSEREPSSFRLVASLAVAGLLSGVILVSVYLATAPRIERNRIEALNRAILNVLPGMETQSIFVLRGESLQRLEGEARPAPGEEAVYAGYAPDGSLVGYAIPADGPGFMDTISLIYGFDPQRRVVVGMEVLESRETPGLGDKIIHDDDFLANFAALAVDPQIVPVKKGKSDQNQVDCITGATISSEAVVSILNRSNQRWLPLLESVVARAGEQ